MAACTRTPGTGVTDALFDPAARSALELLPSRARVAPERRLNGVFAMTPDNLYLLGPATDLAGLWISNGGTEAINLLIEKTRRLARRFDNYRLRILLIADGSRPYRHRLTHAQ